MLAEQQYEEAAVACAAEYERDHDPAAGLAAAKALRRLGELEAVVGWAERLAGSAQEPYVWNQVAEGRLQAGQVEAGLDASAKVIELFGSAGNHRMASQAAYIRSVRLWDRARYRESLEATRLSLEGARLAGDRAKEARAWHSLAVNFFEVGALASSERAIAAAREHLRPEDAYLRGALFNQEGLLLRARGRLRLACDKYRRALAEVGDGADRKFRRSVQLNLVDAYLDLGAAAEAARHLGEAWKHAEPDGSYRTALLLFSGRVAAVRGDTEAAFESLSEALGGDPIPELAWQLEYRLGRLEEERGRMADAVAAYERSITVVEFLRSDLGFDELKAWLLQEKRLPYEALFDLHARSGNTMAALGTLERAKARAFLDAFVDTPAEDDGGPRELVDAAPLGRAESLRLLMPLASRSEVVAPGPVEAVLERLAGRRVLIYFGARERVWRVSVDDREIELEQIAVPLEELAELVAAFLADPDDPRLAAKLGELLIPRSEPVGPVLEIVPDGILGRLPFAALRRRRRFLSEDTAITYVPSLNALIALEERRQGRSDPPVVLGDPLGDLSGARAEARGVARRLGVVAHLGDDVTLESLRSARSASLLHLAAHTGLGPAGPWLNLADKPVGPDWIIGERVGPRVVVLPSCASAAREDRGLWGSLGSAFLTAGSRSVVAALWSVGDEASRRFVESFYGEGGAGAPAEALARVQRRFIAAGELPSSWAPFVHLGSPRGSGSPSMEAYRASDS